VTMTSNANCVTTPTANSNQVVMNITSVIPAVSIISKGTSICAGQSITSTETTTNGGATPTYQGMINGNPVAGKTAATFTTTTLANNDAVTVVMTSNDPCASPATATSNQIDNTTSTVTPTVTIAADQNPVCNGTTVTFTATPTDGGTTPIYQWQGNGVNAGTNSATFSSSTLADGDIITVTMTSNANCLTTPTANSNQVVMNITTVTPAVSIISTGTSICAGQSITFTPTPTNGGANPTYQWMINGNPVAGETGVTFTTTTLNNNDQVTVVMTSNDPCANPTAATSNAIQVTTASVTPGVSIVADQNPVCQGTTVTFTATPVNGGTTPVYQWQVNGANVGTNSPTFSSSTLADGDIVTVIMTSNANCVTTATVTSLPVTMTITSVTPSVTVNATSTSICVGGSITFTAIPTNEGATPLYQWFINGNPVTGETAVSFTTTTLNDGDAVTVQLTSSDACANPTTATSTPINITASTVTPTVTIAPDQNPVCQGTTVTFQATSTDGGSAPIYQWQVNGANVGTNSATFSSSTLADGDVVTVTMTSNANCVTT